MVPQLLDDDETRAHYDNRVSAAWRAASQDGGLRLCLTSFLQGSVNTAMFYTVCIVTMVAVH